MVLYICDRLRRIPYIIFKIEPSLLFTYDDCPITQKKVTMRKKRRVNKKYRFREKSALFIADSYKRSGDRAYSRLQHLTDTEFKTEYNSAVYVIISSFAFSIEVYLKTIVFCLNETPLTGHDLAKLWNQLPKSVQNWLNNNFKRNFQSTGKDWKIHIIFDELPPDQIVENRVKVPDGTAHGMIKGHRDAFQVGRYAFELPEKYKTKPVIYCLPGINLLSQLTRGLAYHIFTERQKLINTSTGESQGTISFPNSVEDLNFPDLT